MPMQSMSEHRAAVLSSMKLTYTKPNGFTEEQALECFEDHAKLALIITCAGNQLQANDGQFIAFIPFQRILTKQDSADIKGLFPGAVFPGVDNLHTTQIKDDIRHARGEKEAAHWKRYVTYYAPADAKRKFNADTAITYSVRLDPGEYYKGKYNHLDALFIQRKGRGYVNFFCFYTDKAKENFSAYWKAMEGVFRYED